MPGTKSKTIERWSCAVPPFGATATVVRTVVPPSTGTCTLHVPSPATVVVAVLVVKVLSVFVAAT